MVVVWGIVLIGIALLVVGIRGVSRRKSHVVDEEETAARTPSAGDAWEILGQPLQTGAVEPSHKRRSAGIDRRFGTGLVTGMGTGLVVAAIAFLLWSPRAGQVAQVPPPAPVGGKNPAPVPVPTPSPTPAPAFKTVVIEPGDSAGTIANRLKAAGLITDTDWFAARIGARGVDTQLKAGTFTVPTGATIDAVIDTLIR
jgi:LysM repeat protein